MPRYNFHIDIFTIRKKCDYTVQSFLSGWEPHKQLFTIIGPNFKTKTRDTGKIVPARNIKTYGESVV
jgi:hypothetical protein